jgi:hypothetical protein
MEVAFSDEVLMFAIRAMRPIMPRAAFLRVFATPLTPLERARVAIAENCTFMEVTAAGQFVFDLVQLIHFLAVLFWVELAEGGSVFGVTGFSVLGDPTLDWSSLMLWATTVRGVTSLLGTRSNLTSNSSKTSVLFLLVFAFEFMRQAVLYLRVKKTDAVANALEFF